MKHRFWLVLLGTVAGLFAADDSVPREFTRLDLRDGRTLTNVVVKSYDAVTDRLTLTAEGKEQSVPLKLIPPPFDRLLKTTSVPVSAPTASAAKAVAWPSPSSATSNAASPKILTRSAPMVVSPVPVGRRPEPPRTPVVRQITVLQPTPAVQLTPAPPPPVVAPVTEDYAAHKEAAMTHAEHHFRYEYQLGTSNLRMVSFDLEADDAKPVTGWDGRCRTEGKALIKFYDTHGGGIQNTTVRFEAVTERKPGESIKVIQFDRKT